MRILNLIPLAIAVLLVPLSAQAAIKASYEAVDYRRIKALNDGTYSLDGKNIGSPNDNFYWTKWLDDRRVHLLGTHRRNINTTATVQLRDGRLLVVSGSDSVKAPQLASNFLYLTKWTQPESRYDRPQPAKFPGPIPLHARDGAAAALLKDGRVLIAGGAGKYPLYKPIFESEIYDPKTNKFTTSGRMLYPRRLTTATTMKDGRVLFIGGYSGPENDVVENVEVFDPATSSFEEVGAMITPRDRHGAVVLDDGRVMIVGGCCQRGSVGDTSAQIEYFNPKTNEFVAGGVLPIAPNGPYAIKLANGKVLMFGGSTWTVSKPKGGYIREIRGFGGTCGALLIQPDR